VPNPSFEYYTNCPNNLAQIEHAIPWFTPLHPLSTSDYFNSCDLTNDFSVPYQNIEGNFQYAHTGKAISGLVLFDTLDPNYREYIEVKLNEPLVTGNVYCVEFYVNLTISSVKAIDAIGAYLSMDSILLSTVTPLSYSPQVCNPTNNIIADTINWIKISGSFIASGGEQFLTIGNFKEDSFVNAISLSGVLPSAYYLFDDISVYPCDAPVFVADAGSNQTICIGASDSVQIGSTPKNEYLYWWTPATGLSDDSIANPKARPAVTTTYYLHQKDFKFDETVDSVTVVVTSDCADDIFIPNIFSPNNDGNNDVLYVRSHNLKDMKFCIYNRWGEMVFESKDINKGWDGRYKKGECNTGVYVYYLTGTLKDGKQVFKKGDVTLFR